MRSSTLATAVVAGLFNAALAQPHRGHHAHRELHEKRAPAAGNSLVVSTTLVPEVLLYVDQFGTPFSTGEAFSILSVTSTVTPTSTSTSTPPPPPPKTTSSSTSAPPPPPKSTSSSAAPVAEVASSSPKASSSSASATPSSGPTNGGPSGNGFGIAYSPYNADGSCKSQDQVNRDFGAIPSGYGMVRTYGTDCNQVATVLNAAKSKGMKMFAGIFDLGTVNSEIETIIQAANGDWSHFDTINVGNELVNDGIASPAEVVAALQVARGLLQAAGYTGNLVTVDTLVASRANPSLCDNSDYCAVNCHPFFDGGYTADQSGEFLMTQIPTLRAVLSNQNQNIVISETGWPIKGDTNGQAVPSPQNQAAALSSIRGAFSSNPQHVVLFSAFNDLWKTSSPAQFDAEQWWGMYGYSPSG